VLTDTVDYPLYGMSNSRYKKTKQILKHNSLGYRKLRAIKILIKKECILNVLVTLWSKHAECPKNYTSEYYIFVTTVSNLMIHT
jgi:hypothetical protein